MDKPAELPVVFLAFANAMDDHLATLKDESRDVFRALQPLEKERRISIHREESSEFDELYQDLLAHDGRVVIFHYGGHADGTMLQLEGGSGGAQGIARLLGQQSSLKLVFLNGCATKDQVKLLHAAGVPAVLATAVKINDRRATQFATAFYAALAEGRGIFDAFELASAYIEGKAVTGDGISINRHPNYDFDDDEQALGEESQAAIFEWSLYVREHAREDLEQWRLPEAREGWRTQLEDGRGPIRTLTGEPLLLAYRLRSRTMGALLCRQCGTASSIASEIENACPVCGSADTGRSTVRSAIPDLFIPCEVDEETARAALAQALPECDPQSLRLRQVHLPYWLFDVDTRTTLAAERGTVKAFDAEDLKLEWDAVKAEVDLGVEDFPVLAGTAPVGRGAVSGNWYWSLDRAVAPSQLDPAGVFVPLDRNLKDGFARVSRHLDVELEGEVAERIGGHQQRNVVTDTRYKEVEARSVMLPHWYAVVETRAERATALVNGQTGAVRFPPVPGMQSLERESRQAMSQTIFEPGAGQEKSSLWISVFSGVGIGIMVGLLMGLAAPAAPAAKTTVGIFIGAVGVGLAALLGLNDRHFSNAKGLRIGSFGLAVAISALSGIYVRDHGLVSPGLAERAGEIRSVFQGISDENVIAMLSAMDSPAAAGKAAGVGSAAAVGAINLKSMQYSGVTADTTVCQKLTAMRDDEASPALLLRNFRYYDKDGALGWKTLADAAERKLVGGELKNFLLLSRDAICGSGSFSERVALPGERCAAALKDPGAADWRALFSDGSDAAGALAVIDEHLSGGNRAAALALLGPALCSESSGGEA